VGAGCTFQILVLLFMSENIIHRNQPQDKEFSLGLTYYEVMDLMAEQLDMFLKHTPREEIVDWLQWNDPNGVYRDTDSLNEFGNIMSKDEGVEIMKRQVLQL
jgi:hypothetical protein